MDERFHAYLKHVKDLEKARQTIRRFDQEVTVGQNDKELRLISGSKIDDFDPKVDKYRAKYAPNLKRMGTAGRTINEGTKKPPHQQSKLKHTPFPKQPFTTAIEKPPDNRFKTKNVQSLKPYDVGHEVPLHYSVPPVRMKGQPLFPMTMSDLKRSWKSSLSGTALGSAHHSEDTSSDGGTSSSRTTPKKKLPPTPKKTKASKKATSPAPSPPSSPQAGTKASGGDDPATSITPPAPPKTRGAGRRSRKVAPSDSVV